MVCYDACEWIGRYLVHHLSSFASADTWWQNIRIHWGSMSNMGAELRKGQSL